MYIYIRSPVSVFLFFLSTVIFSLIFVLSRPFFLLNAINLSNRSLYTPLHLPSIPFSQASRSFFPRFPAPLHPFFPPSSCSFFYSPVPGYNPARSRRLKYRLGTLRYVASDPNAGFALKARPVDLKGSRRQGNPSIRRLTGAKLS